jgi:nickel/cobalt transporter (NiCoT) family protein
MGIETLPASASALLGVVFLLGMRHGLDADHLATIDGLTRFNMAERPRLASWAGVLFSLGHGTVVVMVALAVGVWAHHWGTPAWLELLGAWTSILFLTALGMLNLYAVLRSPSDQVVRSVGLRSRLFGRASRNGRPLAILCIGALFALSFDTISQTSLFALAAQHMGGPGFSLLLGCTFMAGMLVTDGANGLWVARLLYRGDRRALVASRVLGLTIAGLSLLVALFGVLRLYLPEVTMWSEGRELLVAAAVVATLLLSFAWSLWITRNNRLS